MIPTSRPFGPTTGAPLIPRSASSVAKSRTVASGSTVITWVVITSAARIGHPLYSNLDDFFVCVARLAPNPLVTASLFHQLEKTSAHGHHSVHLPPHSRLSADPTSALQKMSNPG